MFLSAEVRGLSQAPPRGARDEQRASSGDGPDGLENSGAATDGHRGSSCGR